MKLPWNRRKELEEKIEDLEKKAEELEEERDSWKDRFEAEKERRSELSKKKQEAEEELNRLENKLENSSKSSPEKSDKQKPELEDIGYSDVENVLRKIDSIESEDKELVTVYCPGKLKDLADLRELKNSISKQKYESISNFESFVAFLDPQLGAFVLRMTPLFEEKVEVGESFEVENLLEFLHSEKYFCIVSAGETVVYREQNGEFEESDRITSRVDREHSKGGFSQGRFERKREEQIDQHMEKTSDLIRDYDEIFLLGDKRFCKELSGNNLGGFDPNRKKPEQFYRFRFGALF